MFLCLRPLRSQLLRQLVWRQYGSRANTIHDTHVTTDKRWSSSVTTDKIHGGQRAKGRTCLVTGGTSGIGFEVIKSLVLEGASSIRIVTRSAPRGDETIRRVCEQTSRSDVPIDVVEADISDSTPEWLLTKADKFTPINTIIHCAGIPQSRLLHGMSMSSITDLLTTNLTSTIQLSKHFLERHNEVNIRRKRANITHGDTPSFCLVNVSSLLAIKGGLGASVYAAGKAGMIAFTRTLALEAANSTSRYAPFSIPMRANVVVPGYIETAMTESVKGDAKARFIEQIPLARFGEPEEVADAIMFLIGNEYANNCCLNLDGGMSAM